MRSNVQSVLKQTVLFFSIVAPTVMCAQNALPASAKADTPVTVASLNQQVNGEAVRPHDDSFVIGVNDVLAINVWKEPDISRSVPVRSDGKISLPLAGEIQASGLTPLKLEQGIASKLRNYISDPEVTVIVQQINSQKFNILGMVMRPGSYPLTGSSTVLDGVARLRQAEVNLCSSSQPEWHAIAPAFQLQGCCEGQEPGPKRKASAERHYCYSIGLHDYSYIYLRSAPGRGRSTLVSA